MKALTLKINAYFAILLVTIFGATASMLVLRVTDNAEFYAATTEFGETSGQSQQAHPSI